MPAPAPAPAPGAELSNPRERITTSPKRFGNLGTENTHRLHRGPGSVQLWSQAFDCLFYTDSVVFLGIQTQLDIILAFKDLTFRSQTDKVLEDTFRRNIEWIETSVPPLGNMYDSVSPASVLILMQVVFGPRFKKH